MPKIRNIWSLKFAPYADCLRLKMEFPRKDHAEMYKEGSVNISFENFLDEYSNVHDELIDNH